MAGARRACGHGATIRARSLPGPRVCLPMPLRPLRILARRCCMLSHTLVGCSLRRARGRPWTKRRRWEIGRAHRARRVPLASSLPCTTPLASGSSVTPPSALRVQAQATMKIHAWRWNTNCRICISRFKNRRKPTLLLPPVCNKDSSLFFFFFFKDGASARRAQGMPQWAEQHQLGCLADRA